MWISQRTIKNMEDELDRLRKENFSLKECNQWLTSECSIAQKRHDDLIEEVWDKENNLSNKYITPRQITLKSVEEYDEENN